MIPPLLFVVREAPQASTGFSAFELLYGRQPRGILDLIKEGWEDQQDKDQNLIQYVIQLRERLEAARSEVVGNLRQAQQRQVRYYNRGASVVRKFEVGDRVLVLLPDRESKLLAWWQGPYEVVRQVGPLDYEVYQADKQKKKQVYHINLLKKWEDRECMYLASWPDELELGPSLTGESRPGDVELASQLSEDQRGQAAKLIREFEDVFRETPGEARGVVHQIKTPPGQVIRESWRRIPQRLQSPIKTEIETMLEKGIICRSHSDWRSPIVAVPKPDGRICLRVDFRKVNAIAKFDAYPMPRVDELIENIGQARYISTLDLTKGYWQVPVAPEDQEKTAFTTPTVLWAAC
ncbi:hypothetical protein Y1Q_0005298 [Alligator mississippiensis]|uniref:ribonuclease H n=1 Tax=Alligator mississippiensis TaxID=8496 RepID=A0A151MTC7_ALLMI|nr:hypothetical protein Y1Q_0005298 [Alligator mississippiensis]